jgi:DNA-binding NarL/FixJ family response regulator
MIRILIVDDHVLLTDSLRMVLESYKEFEIIGTAHNGQEAVDKCMFLTRCGFDGYQNACDDGIEASLVIKQSMPEIKVIILTSLEGGKYVVSAFMNGVDAYILKDTPPDHLRKLIECVFAGFYVMSDSVKDSCRKSAFALGMYRHPHVFWNP